MDFINALEHWHYGAIGGAVLVLGVSVWFHLRSRRAGSSATPDSAAPTRASRETVKVEALEPRPMKPKLARAAKAKAARAQRANAKGAKAEAEKAGPIEVDAAKPSVEAAANAEGKSTADQLFLIFAGEANAAMLSAALSVPHVLVKNREEFLAAAKRDPIAAFIEIDLLYQFKVDRPSVPVIGVLDDPDTLSKTVDALEAFPWLEQVIATAMLSAPHARANLDTLVRRFIDGPEQRMLGVAGVGRVALLAHSSHREARFERMHEFFSKHGMSAKAITAINEVSEELVMNALYDAPTEAGYFKEAIPRTEEIVLPPERACEISYGVDVGHVLVRVRDSFGSLTRTRLQEVLSRCNSKEVVLDESRGGAGLGMWRIFSIASLISITVIPGQVTDIAVRIATANGRIVKKLQSLQLFFVAETDGAADSWTPPYHESDLMDQSITLVLVA